MSESLYLGCTGGFNMDPTGTKYYPVSGSMAHSGGTIDRVAPWSPPGEMSTFFVVLQNAPGLGNSWVFTALGGAAAATTLLTITISGNDTTGVSSGTGAIAANDLLVLKCVPGTGGETPGLAYWGWIFNSTNPGEYNIWGNSLAVLTASGTDFINLGGGKTGFSITEFDNQVIIPCPGTLKNLYAALDGSPGAGTSYVHTVRTVASGAGPPAGVNSALTTAIAGAVATTNSDLVNTEAVLAGDLLSLGVTYTGAPTARRCRVGMTFVADTVGNFPLMRSPGTTNLSAAANRFGLLGASGLVGWSGTTPGNQGYVSLAFVAKAIYAHLNGAAGAGKQYTLGLWDSTPALLGPSVVISGDTTYWGNGASDVSVTLGKLITAGVVPSGTPTVRTAAVSILGFIGPAAPSLIMDGIAGGMADGVA